jgi:UDP-N-acetyl-D-galactosamine dehydrogenase
MGNIIARRVVRFLAQGARPVHQARVGILGLTFKENVPDIRNSRVPDILAELKTFGIKPLAHDPRADAEEIAHEYGLSINKLAQFRDLDALILAVPHRDYLDKPDRIAAMLADGGILADIKSVIDPAALPGNVRYWSL